MEQFHLSKKASIVWIILYLTFASEIGSCWHFTKFLCFYTIKVVLPLLDDETKVRLCSYLFVILHERETYAYRKVGPFTQIIGVKPSDFFRFQTRDHHQCRKIALFFSRPWLLCAEKM